MRLQPGDQFTQYPDNQIDLAFARRCEGLVPSSGTFVFEEFADPAILVLQLG